MTSKQTLPAEIARRLRGLSYLIGNTPLLEISCAYQGQPRTVFAKAEHLNLTGSIKDRMALQIIRSAYAAGTLRPGYRIAEATSGNTGISLAAVGRAMGNPVVIFMPDWMSRERLDCIRSLGATVKLVSREEGGFLGSISMAEGLATDDERVFLSRQFSNQDNVTAHWETTGPEIWWQLRFKGLKPDAFVAGVGTGGTVMGVGQFLKSVHPAIRVHPLEPSNSPTLSTGCKIGKHRIQGISDEFIPPVLHLGQLAPVVSIDDGDAIIMAQKLARELGLGVGISSGANFLGALKLQNELGPSAIVVTVFPDDNKKYLSTDLLRDEPVKQGFLSTEVTLNGFSSSKRVCQTCCDPADCLLASPMAVTTGIDLELPPCPRRDRAHRLSESNQ